MKLGLLKDVYDRLPISVQNVCTSVYGYKLKKNRFGPIYNEHFAFRCQFEKWPYEQQLQYQLDETNKLIEYAVKNSRFYCHLYSGINTRLDNLEDLKRLPIVTKQMVRDHITDIVTDDASHLSANTTGGTTGVPLTVYNRAEDGQRRMAVLDFHKSQYGFINNKMKRASFTARRIIPYGQKKTIYWRYNHPLKQMLYASSHVSYDTAKYYIQSMNQFEPEEIDGHPSAIFQIAKYIVNNCIKLNFQPLAIFPTAETLSAVQAEVIKKAFHCPVIDQYASSEGAPFVFGCKAGNLHADISTGVIESSDTSNEIFVTSFTTYGTPLIRYAIGDEMILDSNGIVCECGSRQQIIKSIIGRRQDFLFDQEGNRVNSPIVMNIVDSQDYPASVKSTQFVQEKKGSVIINIIVDKPAYCEADEKMIINAVHAELGNKMKVLIRVVDDIPKTEAGKFQTIKNLVESSYD